MNEPNVIPMTEETRIPRQARADTMIGKINRALADIQSLNIQPTESNCALICDACMNLKQAAEIYQEVESDYTAMENQARELAARTQETENQEDDGK